MKEIVVVEDDKSVREILVQCLELLDCSIQSFQNGLEALKFLERNASGVHLLIADQTLPGLPGDQLVLEFQKLNPVAPALLMSGGHFEEKEIPVMRQPFLIPDFLQRVKMLLGVA